MHISEGFLPIVHCIGWGVAALPPAVLSVRAVARQMETKRENRVLLAASAAFLFTLSSLRMPSITGSSSHPTGTAVGTYLFGPEAMPALALITLVFQALLLAHGGLTTLGANLFSLGIVGPWVTWLFLRLMIRRDKKPDAGIFVATVVGDLATYVTTAVQLAVAYPSAHGGFLASFLKFSGIFFITQIPISIAEGMLTVALLSALAATQMAALQSPVTGPERAERKTSVRAIAAMGLLAGLVLAIAFANRHAAPVGSDDQAESAITALRPGYQPIAHSIYTPGPVAESVLFAAQGAAGVAILWWALYSLRKARKQTGERVQRHLHLHPHLNDIAFTNHWRHRNPWEKVLFGGGFLVVALLVPPVPGAIVIVLIVSAAAIAGARIPASSWLTVLSVPVSFAILTAVGIMIQFGGRAGAFVSFDWNSLPIALGLLLRSTAAICCLAFIGWTTPLMELIPVFGRIGIPNVLIDLALMIYHFLFVTATTLREMRRAQSWRLGRADYRSRMRALSMLAGGLFIRCIERFHRLENGIESRGYEGRLWVLNPERGASVAFIGGTLAVQLVLLASGLVLWKGAL